MVDLTRFRLYLVRHAESLANRALQWQGWGDAELTERGHGQAADAGARLAVVSFASAWSSDRYRTQQTLQAITAKQSTPPPVRVDARLRERFYGGYEGRTTPEILGMFPRSLYDPDSGQTRMDWRPTAGESLHEVFARFREFVVGLSKSVRSEDEALLVVTHGNILRLVYMDAVGQSEPDLRIPVNAGVLIVDVQIASPSIRPSFELVQEPEWDA